MLIFIKGQNMLINDVMSEDSIVFLNTSLYILLFIFCYVKYKFRSLCTLISFFYVFSSSFSLLFYFFPTYSLTYTAWGEVTLEAVLYQFILYCILILSFSYCKLDKIKTITQYNEEFVAQIQFIVCIALSIYLIYQLPLSIYKFFLSGSDLAEMRDETYGDNSTGFLGIIVRVFGSMPYVLLIISCAKFFLFNTISKLDKYSIGLYIVFKLNIILDAISRASIIFSLMELIVLFIFFYSFISKSLKKKILKFSIVIVPVIISMFAVITLSRFGDDAMNVEDNLTAYRYAGEAQLNFTNLLYPDLKEPFMGFSQFPLFRRLLGLRYDDGLGRLDEDVYNVYIQEYYGYTNPTYIFHGLLGAYVFNWGFYITPLLCLLLFYILRILYKDREELPFMCVVITAILASYMCKGITYADYCSESGNIMILFLIFMCVFQMNNGTQENISEVNNHENDSVKKIDVSYDE